LAGVKKILGGLLPQDKKQLKVFLACIAISTILWGLLRFSEEREDELEIVLNYKNFPKDEMIISELPRVMPIKIRAQGFALLSRSFGFNKPSVEIDLSKVQIISRGDIKQYIWLPKLNAKEIIRSIGTNIKSSIFPVDTIKVMFSDIVTKDLITSFNYKVSKAREHFIIKEPLVSPFKVKVRGAKAILNNLDTISTEPIIIEVLESDLDNDYKLNLPFGVDSVFKDSVRVFLGVDALKEHQFEVPISIKNAPDTLEFKLFPNEVVVSFICATSELPKVTPNDFLAQVDYNDIKSSFKKLSVKLDGFPSIVREIKVEPASVECITKLKD
tara:strand:+ start:551 stop:1534 length:984 start_codon:yes stop_codon:yes gene_type:complete